MAIRWIEGFRYRQANLPLDYAVAGAGSVAVAELSARRAGCYAATLTTYSLTRTVSLDTAQAIVGFAYKWTSGATTLCHFMEGSTTHCSLGITAGGVLTVYRGDSGGTSLGTGSTLVTGTVYYIEIDATVHDSTGAVVVNVDDVEDINLTSQDTQNGGTETIDGIRLEGGAGGDVFADFYIIDPADAAGRQTMKGSGARVDCRIPISAGSQTDCLANTGTNYAAVDDDGYDSDTTYVSSQVSGARDLYVATQMTHNPQSVDAIQVHLVAKKVDSAARSIVPVVRAPDATTTAGTEVVLTTSYAAMSDIYESGGALDDGGAWTQQGVNQRQFGFEIV